MLRNVVIIASSGIVLFSKDYANPIAQPGLIGSLLTALIEYSIQTTGYPVSYMEFQAFSLTIVPDANHKFYCAVFHKTSAISISFHSFIAKQILEAFIQEYSDKLGAIGHNKRDFLRFQYRIVAILRDSIKPILRQLQQQRGILKAILITEGEVTYSTVDGVDHIGILSNLHALINSSCDIMAFIDEAVNSITIQSVRNTCTQVSVVEENSMLVVMYKKGSFAQKNITAIQESVNRLRDVNILVRTLHQTSRGHSGKSI